MRKLVCGVGVNDADYITQCYESINGKQKRIWICPFYQKWANVLARTCSEKRKTTCPSYKNATVCEEWLTFSNFKAWMEQQDWEGKHLDKDLLVYGNKHYSPETCTFLSWGLNNFLLENKNNKGQLPAGVTLDKNRNVYQSRCNIGKGYLYLGCYNTPEEAHEAYKVGKWKLAQEFIALETDQRVIDALVARFKVDDIVLRNFKRYEY